MIKTAHGDYFTHTALGLAPLDIAYHQPSGKLLVMYFAVAHHANFQFSEDYYLATLDPQLKSAPASSSKKLNKAPIQNAFPWDGPPYEGGSIAIHDKTAEAFFTDNDSIQRRIINVLGKPSGHILPAFNAPVDNTNFFDPRAVFSTTPAGTRGLLVAVQLDDSSEITIWGQPLDAAGKPEGTPSKLHTVLPGGAENGPALIVSPKPTANHQFIWLGALPTGTNDTIVELKLSLAN